MCCSFRQFPTHLVGREHLDPGGEADEFARGSVCRPAPDAHGDASVGAAPSGEFYAKLTGTSQDGSHKRWVYTFVEVTKTTAGYLGTGGGFPGMVIACALADRSGAEVHLVESNSRKAAFLREAARATGAPAKTSGAT